MSKAIRLRWRARLDVIEIYRYYARKAGFRLAKRFLTDAEATFTRLAGTPGIGTRYEHEHDALKGLRFFAVSHFRKYLVFYQHGGDGVDVIRVLHGARD